MQAVYSAVARGAAQRPGERGCHETKTSILLTVLLVVLGIALIVYPLLELWFFYDDPRNHRVPVARAWTRVAAARRRAWVPSSRCPDCGSSDVEVLDRGFAFLRGWFSRTLNMGCPKCRVRWRQGGRRGTIEM